MFDRLKRAIRAFVREDSPPPAKEPPQAIQHPEQLSAKKKVERRHPRRIKSRAQGQLLLKVRQQQISQAKADFLAIKVPGPFRPKTDHCTSASVSADRSDLKKNKSMKEKPGNTKNRTEAKESASEEDMGSEAGSNDEEEPELYNGNRSDLSIEEREIRCYPDGTVIRRCYPEDEKSSRLGECKWAFRSNGSINWRGYNAERRRCLSVITCSNGSCRRRVKPLLESDKRRTEQLEQPCKSCDSPLTWNDDCPVRVYRYLVSDSSGAVYRVWEHSGEHNHSRTPDGRGLMSFEKAELKEQVAKNPQATKYELRNGGKTPGSIPIYAITGSLASPSKAKHHIEEAQRELGLGPARATKGVYAAVDTIANLNKTFGKMFLINATLTVPIHFMFQSEFMKDILQQSILDWKAPNQKARGRHGFVMDGNHSFFRDGTLLATCIFDGIALKWTPVLLTWSYQLDKEHHVPHFRQIADQVIEIIKKEGIPFENEYLLHVLDFSLAQRAAHAQVFVETKVKLFPQWDQLDIAAQSAQEKKWLEDAKEAEVGCQVHFLRSALRLESTHTLVTPEDVPKFQTIIRKLISMSITDSEFDDLVSQLRTLFPKINGWLKWWLQPTIASMIFPVKSTVKPEIRQEVPATSNPIEHQHSLLNLGAGKDNDLIEGFMLMFKHQEEREARHRAIREGHFNATEPRDPRPRRVRVFEENDGRPPDTMDRLQQAEDSSCLEGNGDPSKDPSLSSLYAYRWSSPNSCFWDSSSELWFRCFQRWSSKEVFDFLEQLQTKDHYETFLSSLFHHYHRRLQLITAPKSEDRTPQKFRRELELGQMVTRHYIFSRWKLVPVGEYAGSSSWFQNAVRDKNPSIAIQAHFGIQQLVGQRCPDGHVTTFYSPPLPEVTHHIYWAHIRGILSDIGRPVTINDYVNRWMPLVTKFAVHEKSGSGPCSRSSCSKEATLTEVTVSWPKILSFTVDDTVNTTPPIFDNIITIHDVDGTQVTYDLVGRTVYGQSHYTSQIRYQGKTYSYNDMVSSGDSAPDGIPSLIKVNDEGVLPSTPTNKSAPLYVYHRTSIKAVTRCSKESLISNYGRIEAAIIVRKATFALDKDNDLVEEDVQSVEGMVNELGDGDVAATGDREGEVDETVCFHRLNEIIFLNARSFSDTNPKFYPAHVVHRKNGRVTVQWFEHNSYASKSITPMHSIVELSPMDSYRAWLRPDEEYEKPFVMGDIKVPPALSAEGPHVLGYTNRIVADALDHSLEVIIDIVIHKKGGHPIMAVFDAYLESSKAAATRAIDVEASVSQFPSTFKFPLFPGDAALIHPHLRKVLSEAQNLFDDSLLRKSAAAISEVLLLVVATRAVLGRKPIHDNQIFYLGYQGSLVKKPHMLKIHEHSALLGGFKRLATVYERIQHATAPGVTSTTDLKLDSSSIDGKLQLIPDKRIRNPTYVDHPIIAYEQQGSRFEFSDRMSMPQLFRHGPLKYTTSPPEGTPTLPRPRPRPKPRPPQKTTAPESEAQTSVRIITLGPGVTSVKRQMSPDSPKLSRTKSITPPKSKKRRTTQDPPRVGSRRSQRGKLEADTQPI